MCHRDLPTRPFSIHDQFPKSSQPPRCLRKSRNRFLPMHVHQWHNIASKVIRVSKKHSDDPTPRDTTFQQTAGLYSAVVRKCTSKRAKGR